MYAEREPSLEIPSSSQISSADYASEIRDRAPSPEIPGPEAQASTFLHTAGPIRGDYDYAMHTLDVGHPESNNVQEDYRLCLQATAALI